LVPFVVNRLARLDIIALHKLAARKKRRGGARQQSNRDGNHQTTNGKEQAMPRVAVDRTSEMAILRRVVDPERPFPSVEAARAILRLSARDQTRMNRLAAKNREGKLTPAEEEELDNFIRVGQTLGILQSKARRSLQAHRSGSGEQ
jgi:hypothetical protein